MEQDMNMVQDVDAIEPEDLLEEDVTEEPDDSISLEDALMDTAGDQDGTQTETDAPQSAGGQRKEPGYVQGRINKAVEKAVAQVRQEYESQLAPLRDHMIETEARELVRTGKVKDLETAKELVRYRQGQPAAQQQAQSQPQQQPAPQQAQDNQPSPAVQARIGMLQHQADRIRANGGPDVIAEFRNNPETQQKIITGEWDFYDLAEQMKQPRRRAPAPTRSPNGASSNPRAIDFSTMSSEQFAKLEKKIQEGARISLR